MKIAIHGAGIAGPTLAYWLARGGHEPVLIEKATQLRTGGYMIDFWGIGYAIAERMGILPQVHAAGYSVRQVRLVDNRNRQAGGFYTDVVRRMMKGRFTSLPRGDLASAIYQSVENRVETIFGNSIAALEEYDSGVRVHFEQGAPRNFDLVVGADGLHSTVRRLVFGPDNQFETQIGYHVAAFEVAGYRPRDELVYVAYTMPGRQVARFSLREDRTMFLFIFADEHLPGPEPRSETQRKAVLLRVFENAGWECPQILRAMDRAEKFYFDQVNQIGMDGWSRGRTILIGDAASCVSLLAGEGAGLAMAEAYVLAGELKRAGPNYAEAFRCHESRLRRFIENKQKSARNFAAVFAPKTRAGIWIRNQVTKLLIVPRIADFFVGRDLRDDFDLPDYGL